MGLHDMFANYHTHTARCKHAVGDEREYVENAVRSGLKILGFSDHAPYPFPPSYTPPTRMAMEELEDYVDTVLKLRDEYRDDIEIHLGLETEYYPLYFDELMEYLEQYPIEYHIFGQHFYENEIGRESTGKKTDSVEKLKSYVDQVVEGMDTGRFLYLAHPDVINFTGDTDIYIEEMRRICRTSLKTGMPLEINMLGIWQHRQYPNEVFWRLAGEEKVDVCIGIDAHIPERILDPEPLKAALKIVKRYDLNLIEKLI